MSGLPLSRRAFTVVELLVVVLIIVLLAAVTLPAFSSLIRSTNSSMAENKLRAALEAARDLAARGRPGEDAAAVFIYRDERIRVIPCVKVGRIEDGLGATGGFVRDVFVPSPLVEPVVLPRGWMVRGLAGAGSLDGVFWYERTYGLSRRRAWVFPETDFFDIDDGAFPNGGNRQSFMVRFDGGTGRHAVDDTGSGLMIDPRPSVANRNSTPGNLPRLDRAENLGSTVRRTLATAPVGFTRFWIGDGSPDSVLVRPVNQLALYEERSLASGLRVQIDRASGSMYEAFDLNAVPPQNVPNKLPSDVQSDPYIVDDWIEGRDTPGSRVVQGQEPPSRDVRLYRFERYSGTMREILPPEDPGATP